LKRRDRAKTPRVCRNSPLFEAAFFERLGKASYKAGLEVLELFETYALRDPRMAGVQHPTLPGLWLFETPSALKRLPRLVLVYSIEDDEGFVTLWNVYRLD